MVKVAVLAAKSPENVTTFVGRTAALHMTMSSAVSCTARGSCSNEEWMHPQHTAA